jgi:uncharacterized membrane protein YqjE
MEPNMRAKLSRLQIFAGVAVALSAGALALLVVLSLPLLADTPRLEPLVEGALGLLLILVAALLSRACGSFLASRGTGRAART